MEDPGLVSGLIVSLLLCLLGIALVFCTTRHRDRLQFQIQLLLLAFGIRFALSVAIYQFGLISVVGDEDASGWMRGAGLHWNWTHQNVGWLELPNELARAYEGSNRGYPYLLAGLFYITDSPNRLTAAAFNCFWGALTVLFAYKTARSLFSDWVAERVGWWTCLFPSMITWSAMTIKEPVVIMLETIALYACTRLRQDGISPRHLILSVLTILLLVPFRFYAAYVVAAAMLISLLAPALFQPKSAVASLSLCALLVPIIAATGLYARHEANFKKFDLDRVQEIRSFSAGNNQTGTGSGVGTEDVRSSHGLVYGMTIGAAHLLLAPFPWQLGGGSLRLVLTFPELMYWWWLVAVGLRPGLVYCLRYRLADVRAILILLLGFGLLYSLTFGNVGLVFRQRSQLLPWLFIISAVGLEQRELRRRSQTTPGELSPSLALS